MKLTPIVLDFESFWSMTHSLTKMNPVDYVLHPDTEIQSCSITVHGKPTVVVFGEDNLRKAFARLPWHKLMVIGHNMAEFDAMILAWRFGIKPAMWGCTQAMMRALYAKETALSLDASLKFLGAPMTKGSLEATNTKGKYLEDFTPDEIEAMRAYNKIDGDGCMWLFKRLAKAIGAKELRVIDATIRMLVDTKLEIDADLLEMTLAEVKEAKRKALLEVADLLDVNWPDEEGRIEEVRSKLASAPKFSAILEHYGFEVPLKASKTALAKGEHKLIPALSKTDDAMVELCESEHPVISACAQARLGVKSTQLESRIETFLLWHKRTGGKAPVPLRYCGADTTGRWSGTMKANLQNLPRIGKEKRPSDAMRMCLKAPPGHQVVVADLSGIELRVNHFLWKVEESIELYERDAEADLYRAFAAARYGITPAEVTKDQRQLAKVAQLGLGFGAGPTTFQVVAKLMGGLVLDQAESEAIVADWRTQYHRIVKGWRDCHAALTDVYLGREETVDPWGFVYTSKRGLHLPSGRVIAYPSLHEEPRERGKGKEWWYATGRHRARIYAGKVTENIVQALARDIIVDHMLEFTKRTGLHPSLTVHDEIAITCTNSEAEAMLGEMQAIMRTPPVWWPELITWSEGSYAERYGDCK
jgi:hypothetical protein